jgi:hypothetical protein
MTRKAGTKAKSARKVGSKIQVPVLGIPFDVHFVEEVDKDHSMGECDGPERAIKIKHAQTPEMLESTLLHEVCHAILYTSGISELLEENQEEAIVVALENGLSQLYQRKDLTSD